ncbi:MAG: putative Peptidylprolyl isomerase [Candidatus Saccharibacteria bacterium]|nr:putative Peptidylprolyl isomerase [Candidatus Saccharibacteria bacterium]
MAATKGQRIGIWIIAVFMLVGTVGSFIAIVLANSNQQTDQQKAQAAYAAYQKESEVYQAKVSAQASELSKQYFSTFNQFASRPAAFDAASVTELKTNDLIVGSGDTITTESSFTAYYLGWNPTGKVFDGSISGDALKAPFAVTPGGVIEGWTKGTAGMKVGGVRELTIPASLAYGEKGSGEDIPANTPIKFIVMIIPTPEVIPQPVPSAELIKYSQQGLL